MLEAALVAIAAKIAELSARSKWYWSAPIPPSSQSLYINGVCAVETDIPPDRLLLQLHAIEARFGRVRTHPGAARVLDLDLLDCGGRILRLGGGLVLPHPRLHRRAFVLRPLADIAPGWRHPVLGLTAEALLAGCGDQWLAPLPPSLSPRCGTDWREDEIGGGDNMYRLDNIAKITEGKQRAGQ